MPAGVLRVRAVRGCARPDLPVDIPPGLAGLAGLAGLHGMMS
jgi:hypothetical protein